MLKRLASDRPALITVIAVAALMIVLAVALVTPKASSQEPVNTTHSHHHVGGEHARHSDEEHARYMAEHAGNNEDAASGSGQNAANRQQTSLASAASTPNSGSQTGDRPASGVSGGNKRVNSEDVIDSNDNTSSGGCAAGYGKTGEQCVPARAPGGGPVTCEDVRRQFKDGVAVTGEDWLNLDRNNDGTACGKGD